MIEINLDSKFRNRIIATETIKSLEQAGKGLGHCITYAGIGSFLAQIFLGFERKYLIQAGELTLQPDKDRKETLSLSPEKKGWERGEFHAWFVGIGQKDIEVIDLSAKFYPNFMEDFVILPEDTEIFQDESQTIYKSKDFKNKPKYQWNQERIDYLWTKVEHLPSYISLVPDKETTLRIIENFVESIIRESYFFEKIILEASKSIGGKLSKEISEEKIKVQFKKYVDFLKAICDNAKDLVSRTV